MALTKYSSSCQRQAGVDSSSFRQMWLGERWRGVEAPAGWEAQPPGSRAQGPGRRPGPREEARDSRGWSTGAGGWG